MGLAAGASILQTDMANDLDLGRDDIELLGGLFADVFERLAIVGADLVGLGQVVDDFFARQLRRQRWSAPTLARMRLDGDFGRFGRLDLLGFVEQAQLICTGLLAGAGKGLALEGADDLFELTDARFARFQGSLLTGQLQLKRGDLVGR